MTIRNNSSVLIILTLTLMMVGCVSKTTSALTDKADPVVAVERYVALGLEYIKREDYQRARKHLKRALEIDETDSSANAALGLIYHQEGEPVEAELFFLQALESDATYTRGRSYYGAFLFAENRFEESLKQFSLAAEDIEYGSRGQIFSNIALCQIKLGQPALAIAAYKKTLRLDRFDGRALTGISELMIQTNDFEKAQHYYNRLVRLMRENEMKHSSQSLWLGIRIARFFKSHDQAQSLEELLAESYPNSIEFTELNRSVDLENSDD
mgnify:FL=1